MKPAHNFLLCAVAALAVLVLQATLDGQPSAAQAEQDVADQVAAAPVEAAAMAAAEVHHAR